jgi:hypothetical protein
MWACLEPCPLREITSFELDSSRSRKSVVKSFWSHTFFAGTLGLKQNLASAASPFLCLKMWGNAGKQSLRRSYFVEVVKPSKWSNRTFAQFRRFQTTALSASRT